MSNIKSIYSLRELHDLLEKHENKNKLIIYFDIDLTLIQLDNDENEKLIEPEITKKLFEYIIENEILFSFITARFYDIVCNKRKRNLKKIKKDIDESIFPLLEQLGIDLSEHKRESENIFYQINNNKGRCVGILYKGIFFSSKKGETIKYFHEENELDYNIIFIDDLDCYLNNAIKHIPGITVLKRKIKNDNNNKS